MPGVLALGAEEGWMLLERVEGETVKKALGRWRDGVRAPQERVREEGVEGQGEGEEGQKQGELSEEVLGLMRRIGEAVGRMHEVGVVHGDLTTSNLMLRTPEELFTNGTVDEKGRQINLDGDVVLIDFGLAGQSVQDEDKAVDFYVLERAFGSTHPEIEEGFKEVLRAYGESYKGAKVVLKKLEEVRMRGRKKSMIG